MHSYLSVSRTRNPLGTMSSGSKNFHVVSVDANREGLFNSIHGDHQFPVTVVIAGFPQVRQSATPNSHPLTGLSKRLSGAQNAVLYKISPTRSALPESRLPGTAQGSQRIDCGMRVSLGILQNLNVISTDTNRHRSLHNIDRYN